MNKITIILTTFILLNLTVKSQFISEVLEYKPAPSQYLNSAPWGMPDSINNSSSIIGQLNGAMSLGAFGGYVVFKFDNAVDNNSDNPYGIDFVIYGNAIRDASIPNLQDRVTWAEPGVVSVMKDDNMNGLADDIWYELAGSEYFFSSTINDYEVNYQNPNSATASNVPWTDNQGISGYIKANGFFSQPYYPLAVNFPNISQTSYSLSGTRIESNVDSTNMPKINSFGRAWGYADNTLRKTYNNLPDNPYTQAANLDEEGSGGDAFDIDWAVDNNGNYIELNEIDFVKVHTGVMANASWQGEISTEITGAFDVAPNSSITGELDMIVIKKFPDTISSLPFNSEAFVYHKGRVQPNAEIKWTCDNTDYSINAAGELIHISGINLPTGLETISATEKTVINNQEVIFTAYSLPYSNPTSIANNELQSSDIMVYPNPATETIAIKGIYNAIIYIYNITGNKILEIADYSENEKINIQNFPKGMYIVNISSLKNNRTIRFLKM